jgi:mannose/fructose/N-acetylgalactosamine-specific phosphotransferase system component IID
MQREQSLQSEVVEGVEPEVIAHEPAAHGDAEEHIHLAPQSIWPITTAVGITLAGAGLVTALVVSVLGLALMIIAIYYWIQELRHELH